MTNKSLENSTMTVQELIEKLTQFPPNTPVVVRGYESGFNDIHSVTEEDIQLGVNTIWYYGAHGSNDEQLDPLSDIPLTRVAYLRSYNHIAAEDWHGK